MTTEQQVESQPEVNLKALSFVEAQEKGLLPQKLDQFLNDVVGDLQRLAYEINRTNTNVDRQALSLANHKANITALVQSVNLPEDFAQKVEALFDEALQRRKLASDEPIRVGDLVVISISGTYEGETEPNEKLSAKNVEMQLNGKNVLPELEKEFLGMTTAQNTKSVTVSFPADYALNTEVAGKTVNFDLTLHFAKRPLQLEKLETVTSENTAQ